MSTFVSVVKPEPAAYTSSFTRYVSFGAPVGVVEAAMGGTMVERYTTHITQINVSTCHERDVNIYKRWE
jgi:hypothetical protein